MKIKKDKTPSTRDKVYHPLIRYEIRKVRELNEQSGEEIKDGVIFFFFFEIKNFSDQEDRLHRDNRPIKYYYKNVTFIIPTVGKVSVLVIRSLQE